MGPGRPSRWVILIVLAVVSGCFETVGAFLVFGLLGLMVDAGSATSDLSFPVIGQVRSYFSSLSDRGFLVLVAAMVAGFFLVRGVVFLGQTYVQNRIAYNSGVRLGSRLLEAYLEMDYSNHLRRNSSEMIRNIYISTFQVANGVLVPVVTLISESLLVAGILAALILSSPSATLMATALLVPLVVLLLRYLQPKVKLLGTSAHEAGSTVLKALQESIQGIRDVKVSGSAPLFMNRFYESRSEQARGFYMRTVFAEAPRVLAETMLMMFILVYLIWTVMSEQDFRDSLAVLGLLGYAGMRVIPSINRIAQSLNQLKFSAATVDEVYGELQAAGTRGASTVSTEQPLTFRNQVVLDRLVFYYEGSSEPAVNNVSLDIHKGEFVGVVGTTGCGKSTLLDILAGLLEPSDGAVRVDGTDIRNSLSNWQWQLGMVSQAPFLLDDTLRRNIAFGVTDRLIEEDALADSLRLSCLEEFVDSLPDGLETVVGERGMRVSGGQRQRIAIARALYRRPNLLLFDEATSALDNVTEARLIRGLQGLRDSCAVVLVAHRITSLKDCERILVMEAGSVVDSGSYATLKDRNVLFETDNT